MEKIELAYDDVRALAKKLGSRVNREIKHTDILNDIAALFGMRGDALMHRLKQSGSQPSNAVSDDEWEKLFNQTLNLDTKRAFVRRVTDSINRAMDDYTVMIGVINLYSYEQVLADAGRAAADQHLQVFAESIRPHLMFTDRCYAHLEGNTFLVGWPELDSEIDPERRVKNAIAHQDERMETTLQRMGLKDAGGPFAYTVGLFAECGSCIDLDKAIKITTGIAERLATVRKQWPFMHQYKFHY
jgi:GGDEF domain-containing protein